MFLILSVVIFAVCIANVFLGATGGSPFVGDVSEMLILFAAVIAFVIAVLQREAAERNQNDN